MPPVSPRQTRAMFAAEAGKSTLGIPASVGKEYVGDMHSAASRATGLPTGRKIRRGRHAKQGKTPAQHHADVNKHMETGDHAQAKSSALMLAKALHRATPKVG